MDKELHSRTSPKNPPIKVDLDEFQINEDTFKPMTRGLGFHQDTKRPAFKPSPKEVKSFGSAKSPVNPALNTIPTSMRESSNKAVAANHLPTGLEAFYGAKPPTEAPNLFDKSIEKNSKEGFKEAKRETVAQKTAPQTLQFFAWAIDVLVIASFVVLTGALLVFASGIQFSMYSKLISNQDLALFTAAIFSIYYLLYFTILDLSASPGKTIFTLRLVKSDGGEVTVRHTFTRAIISLFSGIALFLPMLLDFQGRLSDTKVVK